MVLHIRYLAGSLSIRKNLTNAHENTASMELEVAHTFTMLRRVLL